MSGDQPPPVVEQDVVEQDNDCISKSNWTSGGKRTKQYYALRSGAEWTLFGCKTREPNEAKQSVWGAELSIIDMMALAPQPIKRSWHRFTASREIVDLGRNKKEAGLQFEFLRQEARIYSSCLEASSQKHIESIRQIYSKIDRREMWDHLGAIVSKQRNMFEHICDHVNWGLELCRDAVPLIEMIDSDPNGSRLDSLLRDAITVLEDQRREFQIGGWRSAPAKIAMMILKQNSFGPAIKILSDQRAAIDSVLTARQNLASHMVDPHAPKANLCEVDDDG
ncbi:MAG TPA: hypothetical protein VFH61_01750 [Thermoleophilia bacterium]|nr:hypothetical protein [Thermoleophilia bacterium]